MRMANRFAMLSFLLSIHQVHFLVQAKKGMCGSYCCEPQRVATFNVPIIVVVIGEGGSGGALSRRCGSCYDS